MPFCTLLEWQKDFDFEVYDQPNERAGGHGRLPEGCLSRIVAAVEDGALVMKVWESPDGAKRSSEKYSSSVAEFRIPPPDRTAAFETTIYTAR